MALYIVDLYGKIYIFASCVLLIQQTVSDINNVVFIKTQTVIFMTRERLCPEIVLWCFKSTLLVRFIVMPLA